MSAESEFIFVACQWGAEAALKTELVGQHPELRLAFSRPGFVTFKREGCVERREDVPLVSTFARTWGVSLGAVRGERAGEMLPRVWELVAGTPVRHLHVWERDKQLPGHHGFEPGITALAEEVAGQLAAAAPASQGELLVNRLAAAGERVLDCVLVEPGEWWVGLHRASTQPTRWPGGVYPVTPPEQPISRAYFKTIEALEWSQLPLRPGERCAEIGCAPGGSAAALLERGVQVMGIDPAEVDESLLAAENFQHIRKRVGDLKRREFAEIDWLFADSNAAPMETLAAVESIVRHRATHIRGLLLTIKLPDWNLAKSIPDYLTKVQAWGFQDARARQLAFNRREFCLAAVRSRAQRRQRPAPARSTAAEEAATAGDEDAGRPTGLTT